MSNDHPWRAVSVRIVGEACAAALAVRDRRFLVAEAPPLPLIDCPWADDCSCEYQHHADRRAGLRGGGPGGRDRRGSSAT